MVGHATYVGTHTDGQGVITRPDKKLFLGGPFNAFGEKNGAACFKQHASCVA